MSDASHNEKLETMRSFARLWDRIPEIVPTEWEHSESDGWHRVPAFGAGSYINPKNPQYDFVHDIDLEAQECKALRFLLLCGFEVIPSGPKWHVLGPEGVFVGDTLINACLDAIETTAPARRQ